MLSDRTTTLEACPFCGGKAKRIDIEDGENAGGSCICCTVCNASGNLEFGFKENFVDAWNRRTDLSQAAVAAALEAAAQTVDTPGDSAVTEALGTRLCCDGHMCGCRGADVGTYILHAIRALITDRDRDALAAHVAAEVAKARAEEAARGCLPETYASGVHCKTCGQSWGEDGPEQCPNAALAQIGAKP